MGARRAFAGFVGAWVGLGLAGCDVDESWADLDHEPPRDTEVRPRSLVTSSSVPPSLPSQLRLFSFSAFERCLRVGNPQVWAPVEVENCTQSGAHWRVRPRLENGIRSAEIRHIASDLCLEQGFGGRDYLYLHPCDGFHTQRFWQSSVDQELFRLDMIGRPGDTPQRARIRDPQDGSTFELWYLALDPRVSASTALELRSNVNDQCLDVPGWSRGADLQTFPCNSGTNQEFWLDWLGVGNEGSFWIRNVHNDQAVTVLASRPTVVSQAWPGTSSLVQAWAVHYNWINGAYRIYDAGFWPFVMGTTPGQNSTSTLLAGQSARGQWNVEQANGACFTHNDCEEGLACCNTARESPCGPGESACACQATCF